MSRTELPQPRLACEGWIPAGPEKRVHKRHMLIHIHSPRRRFPICTKGPARLWPHP